MDVRPPVQRDDRRRRVLNDESVSAPTVAARRSRDDNSRYAPAAHPMRQRPITDLIPTRRRWHFLLWTVAACLLAGLEAAYWFTHTRGDAALAQLAAIDLTSRASLAGWIGSAALAWSALAAWLVYAVRQHKRDDYNGRYRIWLWTACCWLLASVAVTSGWIDTAAQLLSRATNWPGPANGLVWRLAPLGVIVAPLIVRLLLDMRECKTSTALLALGGLLSIAGVATWEGALATNDATTDAMITSGLSLGGYLLVLSSMLFHGRHVVLDAQGILAEPKRRKKKRGDEADSKPDDESAESATSAKPTASSKPAEEPAKPAHPTAATKPSSSTSSSSAASSSPPRPTLSIGGFKASTSSNASREDEDDENEDNGKLSRAERRRLRKEQRRAA